MKRLLLALVLAWPLSAQNPESAEFPTAVAADDELLAWKNAGTTTLNGAIDSSTLSVTVTDGSKFVAPTVITIGSERLKVCSISTNTLTICSGGRGFDNSTAASHSDGAAVSNFVPAYWLNKLAAEVIAIEAALGASLANVVLASEDTSSELFSRIGDETGSGKLVGATGPTLAHPILTAYNIASFPSASAGGIVIAADGATPDDCSTGGGSNVVMCRWDGANWKAIGGEDAATWFGMNTSAEIFSRITDETGDSLGFLVSSSSPTISTPTLTRPVISTSTVAGLSTASSNTIVFVTDGASQTDCTTGGGSNFVLCRYTGSSWQAIGSAGIAVTSSAQVLTNKTLDGNDNTIQIRQADTDCTAEITGKVGELCLELDADTVYSCQPSSGDCDTSDEWVLVSGGLPSGCTDAGSGVIECAAFSSTGSSTNIATEIAAPGAASDSGEHNWYWDSTSGRLCDHKNGASAAHCFAFAFSHATDCTSVTGIDTGVSLLTGDTCHEADADTFYVYDGTAWDQIGGSSAATPFRIFSWQGGEGTTAGTSSTSVIGYGVGATSGEILPAAVGINTPSGAWIFGDAAGEDVFFKMGFIPSGYDLTDVTVRIGVQNRTAAENDFVFEFSASCPTEGTTGNAWDSTGTYSTAETITVDVASATQFHIWYQELTSVDITTNTTGCAAGSFLEGQLERTTDDNTGDAYVFSFEVWLNP